MPLPEHLLRWIERVRRDPFPETLEALLHASQRQGQRLSPPEVEELSKRVLPPPLDPRMIPLWLRLRGLEAVSTQTEPGWPEAVREPRLGLELRLLPSRAVGLGLFEEAGVFQPPPSAQTEGPSYLARDWISVEMVQSLGGSIPVPLASRQLEVPEAPILGLRFSQAESFAQGLGFVLPDLVQLAAASPAQDGVPRAGTQLTSSGQRIRPEEFLEFLQDNLELGQSTGPFGHRGLGQGIQEWTQDRGESWNPQMRPGRRMTFGYALDQNPDGTIPRLRPQPESGRNLRIGFRLALPLPPLREA